MLEEIETAYTELTTHIEKNDALRSEHELLEAELKQLQAALAKAKAERDQAIGETYLLKCSSQDATYEELLRQNRELEDTFVKVKIEHAQLTDELETVRDELTYYQQLERERDNEIVGLSKELEKNIKQREILKGKVQQGGKPQPVAASRNAHMSNLYAQPPPRQTGTFFWNASNARNNLKFE